MTDQEKTKLVVQDDGPMAAFLDTALFEQIQRAGQMLAASTCIPESYQGKPADCAVAIALARQLRVNVVQLMNKSYVIHGRPGLESQFKIALVNNSGVFSGPIDYKAEGEGKTRSWTAFAALRGTDRIVSFTVDWAMVEGEGWDKPRVNKKTGFSQPSKWSTGLADKMGRLRAASYLIDLYAPQVVLGMTTVEELHDIEQEIEGERVVADRSAIRRPRVRQEATPVLEIAEIAEEINTETGEIRGCAIDTQNESKEPAVVSQQNETKAIQAPHAAAIQAPHAAIQTTQQRSLSQDKPSAPPIFSADEMKPITPGIKRVLLAKMQGASLTEADIERRFGKKIDDLVMHEVDDVVQYCQAAK